MKIARENTGKVKVLFSIFFRRSESLHYFENVLARSQNPEKNRSLLTFVHFNINAWPALSLHCVLVQNTAGGRDGRYTESHRPLSGWRHSLGLVGVEAGDGHDFGGAPRGAGQGRGGLLPELSARTSVRRWRTFVRRWRGERERERESEREREREINDPRTASNRVK